MDRSKLSQPSQPQRDASDREATIPKPSSEQDQQRLWQVIHWSGLTTNSFAAEIGLKRSENLYQIQRGNNGISRELAYAIVQRYPQISPGWLLMGEGTMLAYDPEDGHRLSVQETISMTGEQLRRIADNTDQLLQQLDTLNRKLEQEE